MGSHSTYFLLESIDLLGSGLLCLAPRAVPLRQCIFQLFSQQVYRLSKVKERVRERERERECVCVCEMVNRKYENTMTNISIDCRADKQVLARKQRPLHTNTPVNLRGAQPHRDQVYGLARPSAHLLLPVFLGMHAQPRPGITQNGRQAKMFQLPDQTMMHKKDTFLVKIRIDVSKGGSGKI